MCHGAVPATVYRRVSVSTPVRVLRALRRDQDRWLLLTATLLWTCVLVAHTLLTPVWRSPDEPNHFDLVLDVADGRGYASWDEDRLSVAVVKASASVREWPPRQQMAPDLRGLPPVSDSPEMSDRPNHMTQHPPAYYHLLGGELRVMRALGLAPDSVSAQLALTRVLSSLLLVPLPFLAWLFARSLRVGRLGCRVALLLPLVVPGLAQVGSAVSNDALLLLVFSLLAVALARYQGGHRSLPVVASIGVLCGLALYTKAFGAAAVVWAVVVVAAGARRLGARQVVVDLASITALAFAIGGWWYLGNVLRDGRVMPSLEESRFAAANALPGAATEPQVWSDRFFPVAGRGFFGLLGYAEVSVSDLAYWIALVVSGIGFVLGVIAIRRRRGPLLLLAVPLPLLLVLQASQSYRLYETSGVVALGHGRYLLPAFLPCAALLVAAVDRSDRVARAAGPIALLAAVAMHANIWGRALHFFWSTEGPWSALVAAVDWSPLPRVMSLAALGAIPPLTILLMVLVLVAPRGRDSAPTAPTPRSRGAPTGGVPAIGA